MRALIVLVAVSIIAACASQAQKQYQQLSSQYASALNVMNKCLHPVMSAPVTERLSQIFILDINDPEIVQKLANKDYVTKPQAEDIVEFSILRKPCHKIAIEEFATVHPEYVATLARILTEADADLASAINKERTIGEINKRTLDRGNQWQAEFTEIGQRITTQLNQAHQYEMRQRQKAAQALQIWGYQQQQLYNQRQMINASSRPRITNCNYIGNSISCTTF